MTSSNTLNDADSGEMKNNSGIRNIGLVLLIAASVVGNYFNMPMFFGVDFLFGSIFTLLIVALYGTPMGLLSAVAAGSMTYFLWGHPYAAAIIIFETLFVGTLLRQFRGSLILAAAAYWFLIGIPFVLFFYSVPLKMDAQNAILIALKQSTNGIFNATIASLILLYSPISRFTRALPAPTVFQTVLNLVLTSVFLPSLLIMAVYGNGILAKIERDLFVKIDTVGTGLSAHINSWVGTRLEIVERLSEVATDLGVSSSPELQTLTRHTARSSQDFINAYVADRSGTTVTFYPLKNERGESTVGINFSDRTYFKVMTETLRPFVSEVFQGRGGVFTPIVTLSAPVVRNDRFEGYALAALDLTATKSMLEHYAGQVGIQITLISDNNLVVASTRPELEPMSTYTVARRQITPHEQKDYFYRHPEKPSTSVMLRWRDSFFGREMLISDTIRWKLIIETPIAPHQAYLVSQYIQSLSTLLLVFLAAAGAAILFARQFSRPINRLANDTTDFPSRLQSVGSFRRSSTQIAEVNYLVDNFALMAEALKSKFEELQESAQRLSSANTALSQEVDERKRIEAELRLNSRLKDEFMATVSHELRTPLNIINGYVEIMETEGLDEESPELLKIVSRNVKHLTRLIEDLLDISRIISGKITLKKQPADLLALAKDSVDAARMLSKSKNQTVVLTCEEEMPPVSIDGKRMRQVLDNLLSNSIKFTPEGGKVEVVLKNLGESAEIAVRDNGEGVAAEFLSHMFSRFMQEDGSIRRSHGGLGIGLAIVQEIVELHGGRVRAESPGKNQGTSVIVTLPIASDSRPLTGSLNP
jgi:signal transduction histidine kinase